MTDTDNDEKKLRPEDKRKEKKRARITLREHQKKFNRIKQSLAII